jgi:hypothetical protein
MERAMRITLCYGGPLDGAVLVEGAAIPDGYLETGGSLVVWEFLNWELLPMWSGR